MYTMTLTPNRSNPKRYVAITSYERQGDKVTMVRRVYDGPDHRISTTVVPWPKGTKDWAGVPAGRGDGMEGRHNRQHTAKRDWLQLHQALEGGR